MTKGAKAVNVYFAILVVTVIGAAAAQLIIHVAYANTYSVATQGSEASYASLKESLLAP